MTILPDAPWRRQPGLASLLEALGVEDRMVRFVGGAVRDTLMGRPSKDVDCATRHPPEESRRLIAEAGFKAIPTGIKHGTVTAVLPSGHIEVTTLRRDVETDGRHATVVFTDEWREDAARRDFTINALSADPISGEVFDYFGGIEDLKRGVVRFIGDPLTRIAEDHLRILRLFRFQARFGRAEPDADSFAACVARANDLMALSRERISDELLRLLGGEDPAPTVRLMFDNGIFRPIIPEIDVAGIDRLARLVQREACVPFPGDPLRRLGALLPDDPAQAIAIGRRLKLSRAAIRRIEQGLDNSNAAPAALAYRFDPDVARDLILRGAMADAELPQALAGLQHWERPQLPFGGGELIGRGLKPGPMVAATYQAIERRWVDEDFPGDERLDRIASEEIDQALRVSK